MKCSNTGRRIKSLQRFEKAGEKKGDFGLCIKRSTSSAGPFVISITPSGIFNNWRGQKAGLVVGGVRRKAAAVSIKIRAQAQQPKEMP